MMKRKEFMLGATFGLVLAAGATAGGVIDWPTAAAGPVAGATGRLTPNAGPAGLFAPPQGAPLSFADIFQQVAPAVVQINVESRVSAPSALRVPGLPFAIPLPEGEPGAGEEEDGRTARGAGSGFFISRDGYIVTNNHVVADAVEITVVLADERELTAEVVGRDPATDLAVIKVEGSDFPFVRFEEQAQPRVGDWVIAVGNPFGLGGTATAGIVSGLGRQNIDPESSAGYVDFLQIDAAINTGNSGGPTFDIYGRVIGVNSAIYTQTGGSVGIGFAIPASVAKPITDRLIRDGKIERGYVGLTLTTPRAAMWEAYGLPRDTEGALVTEVTPGGPADRGGVEIGDVITAVNGEPVEDSTEATRVVGAVAPGSAIRLDINRGGRRVTANVRAGVRPSEDELRQGLLGGEGAAPSEGPGADVGGAAIEGISVSPLTPALRQRYRFPSGAAGVVVTGVARGTPAARLRLGPGMLITHADRQPVTSPEELRSVIRSVRAAGRPGVVLFLIEAGGSVRVPVLLEFADTE
ncbi:trypsin-like peptidase domain-containing protein [uncultured Brevundimonas sp.]|uniref:trypsin-like peptidase domain-containing protein n=1 Tax=uncultured Brevundimonas sp. TaxID=213418 RepID=UPI0026101FA0|nr:trypsin-like peptidase domain-containing protein [uncultured Brevundimonas sp.]